MDWRPLRNTHGPEVPLWILIHYFTMDFTDFCLYITKFHRSWKSSRNPSFPQAACLYTSLSGQRRIRIHNLSLNTTSSIPEIFRIADLDTHMNWLGKFAMRALCSRAHQHVMDEMTSRAAHTLAAYRRHCSSGPGDVGASPGELVLPQNMKLFPLYVQCLMKTDAFLPGKFLALWIPFGCFHIFGTSERVTFLSIISR